MMLLALLALPIFIGLIGRLIWRKRITWKEVAVHEAVVVIIVWGGYLIGRSSHMADTEIWNGTIASKTVEQTGCCHSYSCNPHMCMEPCIDSDGDLDMCMGTCYDTCYSHDRDVTYRAAASYGPARSEEVFSDTCNAPSDPPPSRWAAIREGEPAAMERSFENYIKAAPGAFVWKRDVLERYRAKIPEYPRVHDLYRVRRVITVGVQLSEVEALNSRLAEINGRLGAKKQVNIIFVITNEGSPDFADALNAAWLGGKKNDLIVVAGVVGAGEIAWVRVLSWTNVDAVKEGIQERVLHLGMFRGQEVLNVIAEEVEAKFVRRPMADFAYLKASIEPSPTATWVLFAIGLFLAIGLQWFFWVNDTFGEEVVHDRRQW